MHVCMCIGVYACMRDNLMKTYTFYDDANFKLRYDYKSSKEIIAELKTKHFKKEIILKFNKFLKTLMKYSTN